jgi:glycosyltransferase involved in cell wall biosynthesis
MLEAMSCGLPVILSDFPHLKDIVQNAGLMFPKGDVRALVDAVATILEDENMARNFGRNGRYKVINNYSWRKTVELTCKLYEDTLESINLRRRRKLPGIFGYHVPEHE